MSQQVIGMSKQSEVGVRLNGANLTSSFAFVQRGFGQSSEVVRLILKLACIIQDLIVTLHLNLLQTEKSVSTQ